MGHLASERRQHALDIGNSLRKIEIELRNAMEIAAIATEFLELGHRESLREAHLLQLIVIQDCGTHVSSILLHFLNVIYEYSCLVKCNVIGSLPLDRGRGHEEPRASRQALTPWGGETRRTGFFGHEQPGGPVGNTHRTVCSNAGALSGHWVHAMRIRCADSAVWIARFTGHGIDPQRGICGQAAVCGQGDTRAYRRAVPPRRFIYTTRRASAATCKKCATPLHGTRALRNTLPSRPTPTRRSSPFSTNTAAAAIARAIPSS